MEGRGSLAARGDVLRNVDNRSSISSFASAEVKHSFLVD